MGREIKFRAWDQQSNTMHIPMTLQQMFAIGKEPELPLVGTKFKFTFNDLLFLQYTGLKDKNGKEIYEGDVVELYWPFAGATYICKVFWFKERGCWAMAQDDGKATYNGIFHYFGSQDTKLMDVEVIGNIYENADFVKP